MRYKHHLIDKKKNWKCEGRVLQRDWLAIPSSGGQSKKEDGTVANWKYWMHHEIRLTVPHAVASLPSWSFSLWQVEVVPLLVRYATLVRPWATSGAPTSSLPSLLTTLPSWPTNPSPPLLYFYKENVFSCFKGIVSRDWLLKSTFCVCADCFQGLSKAFHYPTQL